MGPHCISIYIDLFLAMAPTNASSLLIFPLWGEMLIQEPLAKWNCRILVTSCPGKIDFEDLFISLSLR
jgi:hypothetical protein